VDDPFGMVVSLLRASTPVTAIVSTRVSSEVMGMPCVQVIDQVSTTRPFGPGSGRMGMQLWMGVARCWAEKTPTGAIQARQLAGAVADTLHNLRPTTLGDRYIAKAYTPDIDGINYDPDSHRPFYDVRIEAHASQ
jgi:hypothetical protein